MDSEMNDAVIRQSFLDHVGEKSFPCVAAKAAMGLNNIDSFVATHPACPADDRAILAFLYDFIDRFRSDPAKFQTAVVLFRDTTPIPPVLFDQFMWQRLQALADLDTKDYRHDLRVAADPASPDYSYSLKEEAFYVIGMHAGSSRQARQTPYPAFVFNLHAQFQTLREQGKYEPLKSAIRKRDVLYSGSVNPMLSDFGEMSEARQYSGLQHEGAWVCPLKLTDN